MPPLLTEEESALDPYALLSVLPTSTEKEIRKAYRQQSLKYHPDRNSSAEAPARFREISLSLEILLDVAKKNYVDNKLEGERRRKEKYAELDKKRKVMVDREEDAKKAKVDAVKRRQQAAEEEEIKEAGRRMVFEAQKRAMASSSQSQQAGPSGTSSSHSNGHTSASMSTIDPQPAISAEDLTIILQFPSTSTLPSTSDTLEPFLESRYGPITHLIISEPTDAAVETKKKKRKGRKAVVEFKKGNWGGCWACWKDHLDGEVNGGGVEDEAREESKRGRKIEDGVKARWAKGEVPEWVAWADRQSNSRLRAATNGTNGANGINGTNGHAPNTGSSTPPISSAATAASFGSAPNFSSLTMEDLLAEHSGRREQKKREEEFESMTLFRMRQAERDRLAEEIRKQEEAEV